MNIPTPELAPMMDPDDAKPIKVAYQQRNPDLDPQLIWRGKYIDQEAVTVDASPIYLQEQVHTRAIIEDLRAGGKRNGEGGGADLFDHFGVTDDDREAEGEFYKHHKKWSNRMILGDGLRAMASLAEREGLKGQVQAIYIDPPYVAATRARDYLRMSGKTPVSEFVVDLPERFRSNRNRKHPAGLRPLGPFPILLIQIGPKTLYMTKAYLRPDLGRVDLH